MRKPYVEVDNTVTVTYQVKEADFRLTKAEFNLIHRLTSINKVCCIKFLREQYNIGLYEAKQICDSIEGYDPL